MPLKQEQASPERPRCIGGANEHWGFRNPSRRETERKENINGVKATALIDLQGKDIFKLSWEVCEETRSTNRSSSYSVYLPVTTTVLQVINFRVCIWRMWLGFKKKKKKKR